MSLCGDGRVARHPHELRQNPTSSVRGLAFFSLLSYRNAWKCRTTQNLSLQKETGLRSFAPLDGLGRPSSTLRVPGRRQECRATHSGLFGICNAGMVSRVVVFGAPSRWYAGGTKADSGRWLPAIHPWLPIRTSSRKRLTACPALSYKEIGPTLRYCRRSARVTKRGWQLCTTVTRLSSTR